MRFQKLFAVVLSGGIACSFFVLDDQNDDHKNGDHQQHQQNPDPQRVGIIVLITGISHIIGTAGGRSGLGSGLRGRLCGGICRGCHIVGVRSTADTADAGHKGMAIRTGILHDRLRGRLRGGLCGGLHRGLCGGVGGSGCRGRLRGRHRSRLGSRCGGGLRCRRCSRLGSGLGGRLGSGLRCGLRRRRSGGLGCWGRCADHILDLGTLIAAGGVFGDHIGLVSTGPAKCEGERVAHISAGLAPLTVNAGHMEVIGGTVAGDRENHVFINGIGAFAGFNCGRGGLAGIGDRKTDALGDEVARIVPGLHQRLDLAGFGEFLGAGSGAALDVLVSAIGIVEPNGVGGAIGIQGKGSSLIGDIGVLACFDGGVGRTADLEIDCVTDLAALTVPGFHQGLILTLPTECQFKTVAGIGVVILPLPVNAVHPQRVSVAVAGHIEGHSLSGRISILGDGDARAGWRTHFIYVVLQAGIDIAGPVIAAVGNTEMKMGAGGIAGGANSADHIAHIDGSANINIAGDASGLHVAVVVVPAIVAPNDNAGTEAVTVAVTAIVLRAAGPLVGHPAAHGSNDGCAVDGGIMNVQAVV